MSPSPHTMGEMICTAPLSRFAPDESRRGGQRHHQPPHSEERHAEEVRHERQRIGLESSEEGDRSRRHGPTQSQVLEARATISSMLRIPRGAEHLVQRVGERVDRERGRVRCA